MEEEQGSYQAEESYEAPQETQPEATETVTTQEEVAPKGFTVKYNKEEKFVSEDEAPTWIQKGLNYDKVSERAQQLEAQTKYLEKQAKIYGYNSVDEYTQAVDEYEKQQAIEKEASKYGVPEEFIRQELQPLKSELDSLKAEREQFQIAETQRRIDAEVAELTKNHPEFEGMKDEVFNFAIQNQIKLEHAFKLMTYDSRIESAAKTREQEVIARMTGRDAKQVLSSVDSPNNLTFDPNTMTNAQIDDISRRVRNGERITF